MLDFEKNKHSDVLSHFGYILLCLPFLLVLKSNELGHILSEKCLKEEKNDAPAKNDAWVD